MLDMSREFDILSAAFRGSPGGGAGTEQEELLWNCR